MNHKKTFWTGAILLIVSRLVDFTATMCYSPNIQHESNVLTKIFPLNYQLLGVIQVLLIAFVVYCFYVYNFREIELKKDRSINQLRTFIPYFYFGRKESYTAFLFKKPLYRNSFYSVGYVVTYSLIWIGFIVGTSTTMCMLSEKYESFYKLAGPPLLYVVLVLITFYYASRFHRKEFKKFVKL